MRHYSGLVQGNFLFGWATGGLARNWQMFAPFHFLTGLGTGGGFSAGLRATSTGVCYNVARYMAIFGPNRAARSESH